METKLKDEMPSIKEKDFRKVDNDIEKVMSTSSNKNTDYIQKLNNKINHRYSKILYKELCLQAVSDKEKERSDKKINGTLYTLGHLVACGLIGAGVAEGLYGWDTDAVKCLSTTLGATIPMGLTTSMFDYFAYCKKALSNKVDEIYSNILRKKIENMKRNQNAEELTAQQINDDQMER